MVKLNFLNLNVIIILVIALGHTFIHYSVFTPDGANAGISGFSINEVEPEQSGTFSFSLLVLGFEWGALVLVVVFTMKSGPKPIVARDFKLKMDKARMRKLAKGGTEIDMLYELLKYNHALKFEVVERLFEVDKEKVVEWGHTLEQAGLAKLNYPNIGEPEIVLR
jgi:hypothetical protein